VSEGGKGANQLADLRGAWEGIFANIPEALQPIVKHYGKED